MDADLLAMATSTVTSLGASVVDLVTDIGPLAVAAVVAMSVFSLIVFGITKRVFRGR